MVDRLTSPLFVVAPPRYGAPQPLFPNCHPSGFSRESEEFESFTKDAPGSRQQRLVYADILNL